MRGHEARNESRSHGRPRKASSEGRHPHVTRAALASTVRVDHVDEGVALGAFGLVATEEEAMLISLEGSEADVAPFMTADAWEEISIHRFC
jgi:hypothetical protein